MTIKEGDYVSVKYKGTLENGDVFDTNEDKEPITFQVGENKLLKGFEKAVIGKKEGDTVKISLTKDEAYGPRNEEMIRDFPKTTIKGLPNPKEGMQIALQDQQGQVIPAKIVELKDEEVKLDLNHPLAGKDINFKITIEEASKKPLN